MLLGSQVCSALRRLCRLGLALCATPPQRWACGASRLHQAKNKSQKPVR